MDAVTTVISDDEETATLLPDSPSSSVELFSPEVLDFVYSPTLYLTPTPNSPPCAEDREGENPLA